MPQDDKSSSLRRFRSLNPHPERVQDPLFLSNAFFDPRDLVQVRYEMLRRVHEEGLSVSETAERFGVTRPTWYEADRNCRNGGLSALVPQKRGPRDGHKLSGDVVAALLAARAEQPELTIRDFARLIRKQFGLSVHRRSIERALSRQKKMP